MKDRRFAEIELLGAWKGRTHKKFAIGVVSHRTLNAETPAEVASDIRNALKYVDIENLLVTSDCGFGRQGANRLVAFYKTAAAAQGANIVRREYGLPETYVPCADLHLIQDVVPTTFEDVRANPPMLLPEQSRARQTPEQPTPTSSSRDRGRHAAGQTRRFSQVLGDRR
jgi:hypothetical protein